MNMRRTTGKPGDLTRTTSSFLWTILLFGLFLLVSSAVDGDTTGACPNNSSSRINGTEDHGDINTTIMSEKRMAVQRILHSSMEHCKEEHNSTDDDDDDGVSSFSASLVADLSLLLQGTLDESELTAMMQEILVQQKQQQHHHHDNNDNSLPKAKDDDDDDSRMFSADRHAASILETHQSYDCLEREFDVLQDDFDTDQAAAVLEKCRMIVLRNVFSSDIVDRTLHRYQRFTDDIRSGRIHKDGTTTFGGEYFILKEDKYRLNYMIPRELASEDILANEHVLEILSHYNLLDEDFIVNHSGTLNAQPGAEPQEWHADAEYLYGDRSFEVYGVAGQDLPPFAISMFTPLLKMTYDHGPTEFCLGTAHFRGHSSSGLPVKTTELLEDGVVAQLQQWDHESKGKSCPEAFRRIPLLGLGDVVLFDYMLNHRGGANKSNDLRSMLFTVYSRKWYKDWTFDISYDEDETEFERLTKTTRFAVVQRSGHS